MQIEIPFQDDFKDRMLQGRKEITSRSKRYGHEGDIFEAFGARFLLRWVRRIPLRFVAQYFYKGEGFSYPGEFIKCWKRLHPRKGYSPGQLVYAHFFTIVTKYVKGENIQGAIKNEKK